MKKVLFLISIMAMISSCNTYTKVVGYVERNCVATKATSNGVTTITYECGSLYNTDKVKDKCGKIEVCFDAANAKISGKAVCNDSLLDIEKLIKLAINRK